MTNAAVGRCSRQTPTFLLLLWYLQMLLFPQPVDAFEVSPPVCTHQQLMNTFATVTRERLDKPTHLDDQLAIRVRLLRSVPLRRTRMTQGATHVTFADLFMPQAITYRLDGPPASLGVHKFGRAASLMI